MSYLDEMNNYWLDFKSKCLDKDFDELNILIIKQKQLMTKQILFTNDDAISNTLLIINHSTLNDNEKLTYTTETLFQIENIRNSMIDKIVEIQRR